MKIKAVVKVMNFHSLLRVDASKKHAMHYAAMEKELTDMMRIILNNRNLKLDKLVKEPDKSLPVLRLYIGSDYGFCGNVNTSVASIRSTENHVDAIVVGKKLRKSGEERLWIPHEDFATRFPEIREYLVRAVEEGAWSAIELVYNHYYNSGTIRTEIRRIYPLALGDGTAAETELAADYIIEGDPQALLQGMIISYLMYEVKIAEASAYASENLMRQNSTSESLKKIEEIELEELKKMRRLRNMTSFRKTVDGYIKQKALGRN